MAYQHLFLSVLIFLAIVGLIMAGRFFWTGKRFPQRQALKKRLLVIAAGGGHGKEKLALYKESALRNADFLDRLAFSMPRSAVIDRLLLRAGMPCSVTMFVLVSAALGLTGLWAGIGVIRRPDLAIVLAVGLAAIPYFFLKIKENGFFSRFEEQLPEAMDLLARGLRVGHALSSGIEMVADEMDNPIRSEFTAVAADINLGLSVKEAFENMCARVPSTDLRFFAIAVLIQRETGGSLAQILDNIGRLIRERIQFRRKVKAISADSRISSYILIMLPIAMFAYLYAINRDYVSLLWTDPAGRAMLVAAISLLVLGSLVMNKMAKMEV